MKDSYIYKLVSRYWEAYGGWGALVRSPYFLLSIFVSLLSSNAIQSENWQNLSISTLPNLIGFSLGGFAIWLSIGDKSFLGKLSNSKGKHSTFMMVNASFVHFILIQVLALIIALSYKAGLISHLPSSLKQLIKCIPFYKDLFLTLKYFFAFSGYFLFIYSILSAASITLTLFSMSNWLDSHRKKERKMEIAKKNIEEKDKSKISIIRKHLKKIRESK